MKTAKWYKRFAAMLTALTMMLFLLPQTSAGVQAAGESAVSLSGVTLLINGKPVTNSTKINNGDEVFFAFDWSVNKSADQTLVNPLIADIDFKGIYLLSDSGDLQQGSQARGTYLIESKKDSSGKIIGNTISFNVEESQLQQSYIKGHAVFKGNIAYTADDIGDDGRFDIKATVSGSPVLSLRPEAVATSNARVSKSADGAVYKENGEYFQKYKVVISAGENSTRSYTIGSVADEPVQAGKTSFTGRITASANGRVTGLASSYSSFGDIKGVTLAPGSSVELSYTMKVDKGIITDRYNTWPYGNRVRVDNMESTASPFVPEELVPNVSKSGWLDAANKQIVWTIEIGYSEFTGRPAEDRAKVSNMTDVISPDASTGETLTNPFTVDDFWSNAKREEVTVWGVNGNTKRWKYTYTYTTPYDNSGVSADRTFSNTLKANVDGFDYERTASVTVPGGNPLTKEFAGANDDGTLDWTITFRTPEKGTVSNLNITDTVGADNGLSHEIVPGSVTVNGASAPVNGSTVNIGNPAPGSTVTVTLKTRITDSRSGTGRYYNNAKAVYVHNVGGTPVTIEKNDSAQYETQSIVSKSPVYQITDTVNGRPAAAGDIGWVVTVDLNNLKDTTPRAGDVITLHDVPSISGAPGRTVATGGIYKIQLGGNQWWTPPGSVMTDRYLGSGDVSLSGNDITVKLTQEMINARQILIFYYQQIDDPSQLEGSFEVSNRVSASYMGKDAGSASSSQWKGFTKQDILTKSSESKGNVVSYVIEVNKPGIALGGEENNIFLEDEMGSRLVFLENTLKVTDADDVPVPAGLWSSSYDASARRLSLTLPDKGFYKVKYDALLDLEIRNEGGTNGYYINNEKVELTEIRDEITNTASLSGSGGYNSSKSDTWSAADVTGSATIESKVGDLVVNKYDSLSNELLDGATFRLVPGTFDGKGFVPYNNTATHRTFESTISYSTGNSDDTLIRDLECDILYQLTEISAPADHKVFDGARYIVIRLPGMPDVTNYGTVPAGITVEHFIAGQTISIANDPSDSDEEVQTVVNISKREAGGSDELPGARIRIEKVSGSGDLSGVSLTGGMTDVRITAGSAEFTSGSSPAVITGLPAGTYRMVEDAAPAGYEKASSITFAVRVLTGGTYTVTRDGRPVTDNTIIMEDEAVSMTVSKVDVFGEELPGAALTITGRDADGKAIDLSGAYKTGGNGTNFTASASGVSFISGTEPTDISGLPAGSYVLHETAAPAGYIVAQDIAFNIDSKGRVRLPDGGAAVDDTLIITDNRTYVILKKSDISEAPQIPGAAMMITSENGNDLSGVTVYNGRDVSAYRSTLTFTTTIREAEIRGLPAGRYTLVETYAPEGYERVTSTFTFAVNENGTVVGSGSNSDYSYDPVTHKVIVKDAIKEFEYDITLGLSISKRDMSGGADQLPGARLTIKPDDLAGSQSIDFSAVEVEGAADWTKTVSSVTFTTGDNPAMVKGLNSGSYVLVEEYAPDGYEITTNFYFLVKVEDNIISVVENRSNGYNSLKTGGDGQVYVEIRDYPVGRPEDPEEETDETVGTATHPIPTVTVDESEGDETTGGFIDVGTGSGGQPTESVPTGTVPGGDPGYPVYPGGPSTGGVPEETGRRGPGYFLDPSTTDHIDRNKDNEPEISEDIKSGEGITETYERESDNRGIIALAAVTLISVAVYAVFRKRRREDGAD